MKTITEEEADRWIAEMTPVGIRKIVQEYHALRQGLCAQTLLIPTGADDWVDRAIKAGRRLRKAEDALRKLLAQVDSHCAEARNDVRETTCFNCMGRGKTGDDSCCICRGTGLRALA